MEVTASSVGWVVGFFCGGITGWVGCRVRERAEGVGAEVLWMGASSEALATEALFEEPLRTLLARRMNLERPWGRSPPAPPPPVPEVLMDANGADAGSSLAGNGTE